MERVQIAIPVRGFGETSRRDAWWVQPAAVLAALVGAIIYLTWAAFQGEHYAVGNYLSPLYSPDTACSGRSPGGGRLGCRSRPRS
ncbi:MAG: hypothetical protein J4F37_12810 [Acidobacteria bacterium]|nr:hypothetical protein [Acidobacteriota bacterium]